MVSNCHGEVSYPDVPPEACCAVSRMLGASTESIVVMAEWSIEPGRRHANLMGSGCFVGYQPKEARALLTSLAHQL